MATTVDILCKMYIIYNPNWNFSNKLILTYEGHHTSFVQRGLTIGFALFIVSEVFAFVSVFWAFFHSSLAPVIEIGSQWPPVGIEAVNAFELPLLNTILLLSSGATVTYSHHALIQGNRRASLIGLILTIILALAFTACQGIEYYNTSFSISDSVYGTVFFASTGLHGLTLQAPVKNYIKKYLFTHPIFISILNSLKLLFYSFIKLNIKILFNPLLMFTKSLY